MAEDHEGSDDATERVEEALSGALPVIDISAFAHREAHSEADRESAAARVRDALDGSGAGFFYAVNHGVRAEAVERAMEASRRFFALPEEEKRRTARFRAPVPRGYSPLGKENFGILVGERRPNDLVEKFRIGPPALCGLAHADDAEQRKLCHPNAWPEGGDAGRFREAVEGYYAEMERLAAALLRLFARALGEDEAYFDDKLDAHASIMSLNHYPPLPFRPQPGQMRISEHTDVDVFTVVAQDGGPGGLEVQARGNEFVPVPPVPGALVVNVGDCLEFWTGGRWRSTLHRVALPPATGSKPRRAWAKAARRDPDAPPSAAEAAAAAVRPRHSIAFFCAANHDARLTRIGGPADHPSGPPPVTYAEWRAARVLRALDKLKENAG